MNDQSMFKNDEVYSGVGSASSEELADILKALEANSGITDIAALQGGAAYQPQSLEGTVAMLIPQEKHLTLYKDMPKTKAESTLEEYTVQSGYGASDGGFLSQMEMPDQADALAKRRYAIMKFLREEWRVGDVAGMVRTISNLEVVQKQAAIMRVLRNLNRALYTGNSAIIPDSIDGFQTTIEGNGSPDHVRDLRGALPTLDDFGILTELIYANFGAPDGAGLYVSPGGFNAIGQIASVRDSVRIIQSDLQSGKSSIGIGVGSINTIYGTLVPKTDIFLASEYESRGVPMVANPSNPDVLIEGATAPKAPAAPTIAVAANASTPGSKFGTTGVRPGVKTYRYRVCAVNKYGRSAACAPADAGANVAAGGSNSITITPGSGTYPATGFEIFSEQVAGSGIFRIMKRVPAGTGPTTIVIDKNDDIPGTTSMFAIDMTSVGEMRTCILKELSPIFSQELAKIGPYRWGMVNYFIAPSYYAPRRFCMLKNVGIPAESMSDRISQ